MQHVLDYFATVATWLWTTFGWWLVPLGALVVAAAAVAGVIEWRRR